MTDRILCPVDFSDTAAGAMKYAEDLARKMSAELIIAHAFKCPASWDMEGQTKTDSNEVREQFEAVSSDIPFTRVMHAGPPGPVICWLAQEHDCGLIVMGTHGWTGLRHLLFGSTAEYVLQHARCPVVTVRHRPENEPKLQEPVVLPLQGPGA